MGWMDEQIRQRKAREQHELEEAFFSMVEAVTDEHLHLNMKSSRFITREAISQVLEYYHKEAAELPEEIASLDDQLDYLLQPHGILWRGVKLTRGWYKDAVGVLLACFRKDHSIVALVPGALGGYYFWGEDGKKYKVNGKNSELFEAEALSFYRSFPDQKLSIVQLLKFMAESLNVSDFLFAIVSSAIAMLVGLILPWLNNMLFSKVLATKSLSLLASLGLFYLCTTISRNMLSTVYSLFMSRVSTKVQLDVESATMIRVLNLPASFFRSYNAGELSSRIFSLNSLCSILLSTVLSTSVTSLFSLAYLFQIANFTPALALPAVVILLVTFAVSILNTIAQQKTSLLSMELESKERGMSYAMISGIRKIRITGAEKRSFSRWARQYAKGINCYTVLVRYSPVITTAISMLGTLALYYYAISGGVTISEYQAFSIAFGLVSGAFMSLSSIVNTASSVKPSLDMAKPILETLPEITKGKQQVASLKGSIEMDNVCFRYHETQNYVTDHLSLKIRAGEYVAIVGKTGCGKSTLIRLLIGFETPQLGSISYDGKNIANLDLKSLRRKIGVVTQNGKLIQGNIRSNILITAPWLTEKDAWEAAEIAGIAEDIRDMPMGMETLLSEGGGSISGGQKQRLLIARAIAPKPQILIFDEATSALDNITQRRIAQALDELHCTRIVIAHRLSTIKHCDRILVLDQGRILASGRYEELLETCSFFRELVERQRISE